MEEQNTVVQEKKRPVFLTIICILSFVAAGFAIVGYIIAITAMGVVSSVDFGDLEGVTTNAPSAGMTWAYVIVGLVATLVALFGVLKMWKLKKVGFMLYAGASIASSIMSIVYSGFSSSITGIVITVGFIVMYYINLKHMD